MATYWSKDWHEVYYETEYEKERRIERAKFKKWWKKSSLRPLGERTAKIARELGYNDINDLRADMLVDLEGTLYQILKGYSSRSARSRHVAIRLLSDLEITIPPKVKAQCKCCGQEIEVLDAVDRACEKAKKEDVWRRFLSYDSFD
tara:strand:- start:511 stop:948 length:438 start_codon:yes stop_codon:yes gene_type:complete